MKGKVVCLFVFDVAEEIITSHVDLCRFQLRLARDDCGKTGFAEFYAFDPATGNRWELSAKAYLTPRQETLMAQDPYLIREMARHFAADLKGRGVSGVQIQASAFASLNGRPSQPLIDPHADLAKVTGSDWILPLTH